MSVQKWAKLLALLWGGLVARLPRCFPHLTQALCWTGVEPTCLMVLSGSRSVQTPHEGPGLLGSRSYLSFLAVQEKVRFQKLDLPCFFTEASTPGLWTVHKPWFMLESCFSSHRQQHLRVSQNHPMVLICTQTLARFPTMGPCGWHPGYMGLGPFWLGWVKVKFPIWLGVYLEGILGGALDYPDFNVVAVENHGTGVGMWKRERVHHISVLSVAQHRYLWW